jgi:hypothetical protein
MSPENHPIHGVAKKLADVPVQLANLSFFRLFLGFMVVGK